MVVTALLIALFPAALLWPAVEWLRRRGLPPTLVALLLLVTLLGGLALVVRLIAPAVAEEVPSFVDAADRGVARLQEVLSDAGLPFEATSVDALTDRLLEAMQGSASLADRGLSLASTLVDVATGIALMLFALFFYLRDGHRLWSAITDLVPRRWLPATREIGSRVWWTLGAYLRGQLVVALFDAVFIALGLWLLGVPLVLPLAIVVFFGALFPIVGAFVSGLLAVLVALAESGFTTAALTFGLIIVVQQIEGNLLQPFVLSRVIALHPLVIVTSITAGALVLGVLGAFIAVPLAASVARAVDYLRDRTPQAGPGSDDDEEDAAAGTG